MRAAQALEELRVGTVEGDVRVVGGRLGRTTGPLPTLVISTRSQTSDWRGLGSWDTTTSSRWIRGAIWGTLASFSSRCWR